jgi:DNA polymerase III epsilon subunit family exonuclease
MPYLPESQGKVSADTLSAIDTCYGRLLDEERSFDYDDLILRANLGLRSNDETLEAVRKRARWLMIDEYQDVSAEQYALITLIASPHDPRARLFAVGDPRQSIYRFRGADSAALIRRLKQDYQPLQLTLTENFRSVASVVSCANALQGSGEHPALVSVDQALARPVQIYSTPDDVAECRRAAKLIEQLLQDGDQPGSIAILYSTHLRADLLEQTLASENVPVYRHRRNGLHERPETAALLALMKGFAEPADTSAMLKTVGLEPSWHVDELDWLDIEQRGHPDLQRAGVAHASPALDRRLATLRRCLDRVWSAQGASAYQLLASCLFDSFGALLECVREPEWPDLLETVSYARRYVTETHAAIQAAQDGGQPIRIVSSGGVDAELGRIILEDVVASIAGQVSSEPFVVGLGCDPPKGRRGLRIDTVYDRTMTVTITLQTWLLAQLLLAPRVDATTSFVAIDLETNSEKPQKADIIEIGAVRFDRNGVGERFQSLVRAGWLPRDISDLTGIRLSELQSAPKAEEVLREFSAWLRADDVLVGHNVAEFDLSVLNRHLARASLPPIERPTIDTLALSRRHFPGISHELPDLQQSFGLTRRQSHRALPDAETTRELFQVLLDERDKRLAVRTVDDALPLLAASILDRQQPRGRDEDLLVTCGARRLRLGVNSPFLDRAMSTLGAIWASLQQQLLAEARGAPCREEEAWAECRQEWLALLGHHAHLYPDLSPSEVVGSLALSFQSNPDLRKDRITMMTIHAAKGKEWPTVIIIGAEDDQFPASRDPLPEELEEGNRLLYVGATRARSRLAILHARQRDDRDKRPSRFLSSLPDDPNIVRWQGRQNDTPSPAGRQR